MVIGLLSQIVNPAEASVIKFGNLNITLPDSVTITGAEVGTGARNCSFKVSVDADAGTTIPLRAMVVVNLVDALGTTIDNNYSQATVEGLTHQEFTGVFHCNASVGTLKPPYKFSGTRHRHQVRMGCRHQTSRTTHDRSTHLLCCCTLGGRHWQRPSVRLHAAPGTQATRAHLSVRELNARLAEHKDNCTFNAFAVAQEVSDVASTVVAAAVHVGLLQIGSHHCIYVCSN